MKDRIFKVLEFPRQVVREGVDLDRCTHAGNFSPQDPVCAECASRLECSWLYHNDEFSALTSKTIVELAEALDFALMYIEAYSFRAGHRPKKHCPCEVCAWIKHARELRFQAEASD